MYLNKCLIVGNLTKAVELKALPNGTSVAQFSVATNLVYKDNSGAKKEQVEYHNIVTFGKQAEMCNQYLIKGQQVMIEGRIQTRSWEKENVKHYRTEIIADRVQFGNKPKGAETTPTAQDTGRDDTGFNQTQTTQPEVKTGGYNGELKTSSAFDYPEDTVNIDDIPF
jgi:single-strand DNA-binding protein